MSDVVLKTDKQTVRHRFYAGELFKLSKVFEDTHGTVFGYIEHADGRKLTIDLEFIEYVTD